MFLRCEMLLIQLRHTQNNFVMPYVPKGRNLSNSHQIYLVSQLSFPPLLTTFHQKKQRNNSTRILLFRKTSGRFHVNKKYSPIHVISGILQHEARVLC